ncbi:MAG: type VI secretion system contractile sheath large subunit [Lysobacterales bacterium]
MTDETLFPNFGQLDTPAPEWAGKRPVRIVLMGDFSAGAAAGRLEKGDDLARRKLLPVDFDSLEDVLARLEVRLALPLGENGGVELEFSNDLDDFHPDELYDNVEVFEELYNLSGRLSNASTAAEVQSWSADGNKRVSRMGRHRSRGGSPAADAKLSDFASLAGEEPEVDTDVSVDDLVRSIVGPFVEPADSPNVGRLTKSVDEALSDAMRAVLHNSEFQNLESLWRGLDMLVHRLDTGPRLQLLLLDMSAEEFAADLSSVDDLAESGLYSLLVDKPSQEENGGMSMICGLYQFEASPPHIELLGRMAKIAAHAGASFVTSMASDTLMDRKVEPHPLVAKGIEELRSMPGASRLVLLTPRFMLRYPYGSKSDPISAFEFEEFTASNGLRGMLWGHPAILAACALAGANGKNLSIGDLPFYYMVDGHGDQIALPCTERLINTDKATQLSQYGICAVMAFKGQPEVRLAGLDAVNGDAIELQMSAKPAPQVAVSAKAAASAGTGKSEDDGDLDPDDMDTDGSSDDDLDDLMAGFDDDGGDDDLDDLMAGLDDDDDDGDGDLDDLMAGLDDDDDDGDSDLDDLLAGFGDDDDDDMDDDEMDPDLAELLNSLD